MICIRAKFTHQPLFLVVHRVAIEFLTLAVALEQSKLLRDQQPGWAIRDRSRYHDRLDDGLGISGQESHGLISVRHHDVRCIHQSMERVIRVEYIFPASPRGAFCHSFSSEDDATRRNGAARPNKNEAMLFKTEDTLSLHFQSGGSNQSWRCLIEGTNKASRDRSYRGGDRESHVKADLARRSASRIGTEPAIWGDEATGLNATRRRPLRRLRFRCEVIAASKARRVLSEIKLKSAGSLPLGAIGNEAIT